MPGVRDGRWDAGLVIHEARFTYPDFGLTCVADLGEWWEGETGLPIPLGAILADELYAFAGIPKGHEASLKDGPVPRAQALVDAIDATLRGDRPATAATLAPGCPLELKPAGGDAPRGSCFQSATQFSASVTTAAPCTT